MNWGNVSEKVGNGGFTEGDNPEDVARQKLQNGVCESDSWGSFPPGPEEVAEYLEGNYIEGFEEEAEAFVETYSDVKDALSDVEEAAVFKVGAHLAGDFVTYQDTAEVYDVYFNSSSPSGHSLWYAAKDIKEEIGLEAPLKRSSLP